MEAKLTHSVQPFALVTDAYALQKDAPPKWIETRRYSDNNFFYFVGIDSSTSILDEYLTKAKQEPLCGVPAEYWLHFFKVFVEQRDDSIIKEQIEKLKERVEVAYLRKDDTQQKLIADILSHIEELLSKDD